MECSPCICSKDSIHAWLKNTMIEEVPAESFTVMQVVLGDYHIGFAISGYSSPSNTLFNGSSCMPAGSCRPTLRLCFRDAGHSHSDVESSCYSVINREDTNFVLVNAEDEPSIPLYYPVSCQ